MRPAKSNQYFKKGGAWCLVHSLLSLLDSCLVFWTGIVHERYDSTWLCTENKDLSYNCHVNLTWWAKVNVLWLGVLLSWESLRTHAHTSCRLTQPQSIASMQQQKTLHSQTTRAFPGGSMHAYRYVPPFLLSTQSNMQSTLGLVLRITWELFAKVHCSSLREALLKTHAPTNIWSICDSCKKNYPIQNTDTKKSAPHHFVLMMCSNNGRHFWGTFALVNVSMFHRMAGVFLWD